MSTSDFKNRKPSAAARAEAAAWVARLHGPNRTPEAEAGLRRWLADDPEHLVAFELLTDTWEKSTRLRRRPIERVASWELVGFRMSVSRVAFAAIAIAFVAVFGTLFFLHSDVVATGIGELRTLTLEDGTRIHMNSSTRLVVDYDEAVRQVRLESGEAFFEVARNPRWPFIVTADGHRIRALGTKFDVRTDGRRLAVTLIEGKVTVTPVAPAANPAPPARQSAAQLPGGSPRIPAPPMQVQTFTLSPGERLTLASTGIPKIDRPALDLVTAWERGQVVFDNVSLAGAVREMNRYNRHRIVIDDPAAASIRVSGIFQAGDSADFAAALAKSYHLSVGTGSAGSIVLAPENPPPARQDSQ